MRKNKRVFTSDGHCLGSEYIDLDGLEVGTKEAVYQLIYLDDLAHVKDE